MIGSVRNALMTQTVALPAAMAAYGFSEGSGTTSADSSGNAHTLTLNSTTWGTGHTGGGLTGTGAILGAKAAFIGPTVAITIMGWVNAPTLTAGTTHTAFGFMDNAGNTDVVIFAQRADFGTPNILQGDIRLNNTLTPIYGPALTAGVWTHLALTYNGSTITLYKDGVSVGTSPATGAISPGDGFFVAGWSAVTYEASDVTVDDVRVFNSALTAAQVASAMRKPV